MPVQLKNNATTTLSAAVTTTATSITVADGSVFPTLSGSNYTYATLEDNSSNREIVKVTAISTNTLTVVRAQDNTTARAFSSGDKCELRINAALLNDIAEQADTGTTVIAGSNLSFSGDTLNLDTNLTGLGSVAATSMALASTGATELTIEDTDNGFAASKINVQNGGRDLKVTVPQDIIFNTGGSDRLTLFDTGAITATGDITISSAGPSITLTDTDNNPDYQIKNGNGTFRVIDTTNSVDRINITSSLTTFANAITSSGTITSATNAPQVILSDTGNGGGGGAEGKVLFANTNGNAIGIGYTGDVTADSDLIISTNGSGTYGGYLGLDAAAIADTKADIVLEPKTSVRIFTDSDALKLSSITNAQPVRVTFTSDTSSPFQEGHIEYTHADGSSYGSNEAFIFGGSESTMTVLADGKLMTKDGLYIKPSSGTGQGTQVISSAGNLTNIGSMDLNATATDALHVIATDDSPNSSFTAVLIDHNASGSTALSTDRAHIALKIDFDSTATGGTTSDEHRIYGINANVKATGDSDLIHGSLFTAEAEHSAGQVSALYGVYGTAVADLAGSAILSNAYGGFFYAQSTCASGTDPSGLFGLYGKAELQGSNDVDWTQILGGYFEVEFETSGTATTVDNAYVIRGLFDQNSTDTTVTNGYLINLQYSGTANITNRYGIYLSGATQNHIAGTIQGSDGSLSRVGYGFISDINTGMFSPANHSVALAANGSQELTVTSGLVTVNRILTGLGSATSPAVQVGDTNSGFYDSGGNEVALALDGVKQYEFTGTTLDMTANTITNNGGIAMNANTVLSVGTSPGDAFNGDASIRIGDTANNYVQIITGTGNQAGVLIGDSDDDFEGGFIYSNNSDTLNLHANNTTQLALRNGSAVFTASTIDIPSQIRHVGDTDTYIQFHASNQFRIVTGGSERFEQNQGTTTIAGTLNVRQAIDLADNDILRLGSGDDAEFFVNGSHLYLDLNSGIGNFYIRDGSTTRYTFNDNGNFTATGNVTAYSDRRVKAQFEPIIDALSKVQQLHGQTYIRTDMDDANRRYAGLIAQDVELVLPEAVSEVDEHLALDYSGTIALLVEAIKDLKAEVDELKTKLEAA